MTQVNLMLFAGDDDRWLDDAACADLPIESFFVQAGHVIDQEVLNVCRTCPVREQCLRHAYDTRLNITGGYFGGMSPGQRRDMTFEQALEFCRTDHPVVVDQQDSLDQGEPPVVYS